MFLRSSLVAMMFVVAFAATGCGMSSMTPTTAGAKSVPFDQQFIDMMVPHHEGAIEMARIAEQRSQRPEVRQMATDILRTQAAEIEQMKAWRKAWYGSEVIAPGNGGHQMAGMDTDLAQLENARPFDKAFIDAMLPHHQSAIEMSRPAQQQAQHQEIKDLAGRIIAAQQKEIDQMKAWRAQWYPGQ